MHLSQLIAPFSEGPAPLLTVNNPAAMPAYASYQVVRVVANSKEVGPGCVFVALQGTQSDGHQFVAQAIEQGAVAVVVQANRLTQAPFSAEISVPVLVAQNTYEAFALLNAQLQNWPGKALQLVGVTGTNGKTTVTHLLEAILNEAGGKTGLIGTLGSRKAGDAYAHSGHTTPMADQLQARLHEMQQEGLEAVVMEVSSHALEQHRVAGCHYAVAVHTNLTQDHLDYHQTMSRYFEAKALLFSGLQPGACAVINADDAYGEQFLAKVPAGVKTLTYALKHTGADVRATDLSYSITGAALQVVTPKGTAALKLKLAGEFSVYNALGALAAGLALNIPLAVCIAALEKANGVRGRFEVVSEAPYVLVDYAHTPDGLENVLQAAKAVLPQGGKLWVVFGCGGDRDATKRPKMGAIAEAWANHLVITSDNPRSEDPQQIITDILAGIKHFNPQHMQVHADRRAAIALALDGAGPQDIVVVAGKGHEDYQILSDRVIHFDDREEVQAYLAKKQTVGSV